MLAFPLLPSCLIPQAKNGGVAASAGSGSQWRETRVLVPSDLPLHYEGWDRTRFAYAIFLLNKDVEQLLHAHGLASDGPRQVLANLYKLVLAAQSGSLVAAPAVEEPAGASTGLTVLPEAVRVKEAQLPVVAAASRPSAVGPAHRPS